MSPQVAIDIAMGPNPAGVQASLAALSLDDVALGAPTGVGADSSSGSGRPAPYRPEDAPWRRASRRMSKAPNNSLDEVRRTVEQIVQTLDIWSQSMAAVDANRYLEGPWTETSLATLRAQMEARFAEGVTQVVDRLAMALMHVHFSALERHGRRTGDGEGQHRTDWSVSVVGAYEYVPMVDSVRGLLQYRKLLLRAKQAEGNREAQGLAAGRGQTQLDQTVGRMLHQEQRKVAVDSDLARNGLDPDRLAQGDYDYANPPVLPLVISEPPRRGKSALALALASVAIKLGGTVFLGVAPNKLVPRAEMVEKLSQRLQWTSRGPADTNRSVDQRLEVAVVEENGWVRLRDPSRTTLDRSFAAANSVVRDTIEPGEAQSSEGWHEEVFGRVSLYIYSIDEGTDVKQARDAVMALRDPTNATAWCVNMIDEAQRICKDDGYDPKQNQARGASPVLGAAGDGGAADSARSSASSSSSARSVASTSSGTSVGSSTAVIKSNQFGWRMPPPALRFLREMFPSVRALTVQITATQLPTLLETQLWGSQGLSARAMYPDDDGTEARRREVADAVRAPGTNPRMRSVLRAPLGAHFYHEELRSVLNDEPIQGGTPGRFYYGTMQHVAIRDLAGVVIGTGMWYMEASDAPYNTKKAGNREALKQMLEPAARDRLGINIETPTPQAVLVFRQFKEWLADKPRFDSEERPDTPRHVFHSMMVLCPNNITNATSGTTDWVRRCLAHAWYKAHVDYTSILNPVTSSQWSPQSWARWAIGIVSAGTTASSVEDAVHPYALTVKQLRMKYGCACLVFKSESDSPTSADDPVSCYIFDPAHVANRHADYGAPPPHWESDGAGGVGTMEFGSGTVFADNDRAWHTAFQFDPDSKLGDSDDVENVNGVVPHLEVRGFKNAEKAVRWLWNFRGITRVCVAGYSMLQAGLTIQVRIPRDHSYFNSYSPASPESKDRRGVTLHWVPRRMAVASSKDASMDTKYQLIGRGFVDMKDVRLPPGWQLEVMTEQNLVPRLHAYSRLELVLSGTEPMSLVGLKSQLVDWINNPETLARIDTLAWSDEERRSFLQSVLNVSLGVRTRPRSTLRHVLSNAQ